MKSARGVTPRGPRGYPLLGHLPMFLKDRLGFLTGCAATYGNVVRLYIGAPTFLITHPEDIRHVLILNSDNYEKSKRMTSPAGRKLSGSGLLTKYMADHLPTRRMLQPVFYRNRMEAFADLFVQNTVGRISSWQEGVLDFGKEMIALTLENILRALLGHDYIDYQPALNEAIEIRRKYIGFIFRALHPFPERWPSHRNREYRRAIRTIDNALYTSIRKRRRMEQEPEDLLSMFVQARYEDGSSMTDQQVRDEALTLCVTGFETTGEALTWTCYLLSQHPDVRAKLNDEIWQVLNGRLPQANDIGRLPYAGMVLAESLRLYPPTWLYIRMANGPDVLPSGVQIRAGSKLYLSQYVSHRNPEYFPDPERFDPERFSESGKQGRPAFAYFPFGGGPRVCIGEHFAKIQATLVLATLMQRIEFTLEPGQIVEPEPGITLTPKYGIRMKVTREEVRNLNSKSEILNKLGIPISE